MPGIVPRFRELVGSGFGWIASLMASIFGAVRLLPAGHPYLNPANTGRFGIRHVIAQAANHLILKKENIDQILIFFTIVTGFVLLVMQFVLLIAGFLLDQAHATSLFVTANPQEDIALTLLDHVFGVQGLSCIGGGTPCTDTNAEIPTPFHRGLHAMFRFYSTGLLLVAILIFLYYVLLVVGETTTSGTPFGRRFNHAWAPLRLIVALGLLVPISGIGLNSAQYLTLYAAKWGSAFATNGWRQFNDGMTFALGNADAEDLIAVPDTPDLTELVAFMSLVRTCQVAYAQQTFHYDSSAGAYRFVNVQPFLVSSLPAARQLILPTGTSYRDALNFYDNGNVRIVFGQLDPAVRAGGGDAELHKRHPGYVAPLCGELVIHTNEYRDPAAGGEIGATAIQEEYYDLIIRLFYSDDALQSLAFRAVTMHLANQNIGTPCSVTIEDSTGPYAPANVPPACNDLPDGDFQLRIVGPHKEELDARLVEIRTELADALATNGELSIDADLLNRGWAGAGMFFNQLAAINGAFFAAASKAPVVSKVPLPMSLAFEERRASNASISISDSTDPQKAGGDDLDNLNPDQRAINKVLFNVSRYWQDRRFAKSEMEPSGNIFIDMVEFIFGVEGMMNFRDNADVHPMAALTGLGKSIMDRTVIYMMFAVGGSAIGGLAGAFQGSADAAIFSALGDGASSIAVGLVSSTMVIGFVLYYVLPFLPFIYFFFAVGAWVKGIFEAMVGVPLWALAHLKIDGEGLPGDTARNGYFLIFEIFLRPILIVFGLIISVLAFSALVRQLNIIFDDVLSNMTGFTNPDAAFVDLAFFELKRGPIDEFFFTIIYTIIVYMIGTTSFKLIDRIPQSIMRWMGAGVQTFADQTGDPAGGLTQYAAIGGATIGGQAAGALTAGSRAVGTTGGGLISGLMGRSGGMIRATGGG